MQGTFDFNMTDYSTAAPEENDTNTNSDIHFYDNLPARKSTKSNAKLLLAVSCVLKIAATLAKKKNQANDSPKG